MFSKTGPLSKFSPFESDFCVEDIDNQLIGLEIDVLNGSKPGVYPNMSKTGLQIVGFGHPNSMAIEVRSEDTDKNIKDNVPPKGAFETVLYVKNSIQPEYGRLVVADFESAKIGLDFEKPIFSQGVIKAHVNGVGTGIILNNGSSGEIYGGNRWFNDSSQYLSLRAGSGGMRVLSNDNTQELITIDNNRGIYINGDIYIYGQKITANKLYYLSFFLILLTVVNLVLFIFIIFKKSDNKKIGAQH